MSSPSPSPSPDSPSEIVPFIAALPKAELHIHLEGSVDADTLWELATQQRSPLFAQGRAAVDALYQTSKFSAFLDAFKVVCLHLQTPDDYELITYRALQRMAAQNVRYAEITLSVGVMVWREQAIDPLFSGVERGARRARRDFAIRAQWIFDAVRHLPLEQGWEVARSAARLTDRGVVGIGIGGNEASGPAENFGAIFEFASQRGLRRVAHAGEAVGPESIWSALRILHAERIGHGLSAAADRGLVEQLAQSRVPVEICLTSNLRTGGISEISRHPLRDYFDAGMHVSLHTDDPALFGVDLNSEYLLAHQVFGFSREELRQLAVNSFEASFLPPNEQMEFLKELAEH